MYETRLEQLVSRHFSHRGELEDEIEALETGKGYILESVHREEMKEIKRKHREAKTKKEKGWDWGRRADREYQRKRSQFKASATGHFASLATWALREAAMNARAGQLVVTPSKMEPDPDPAPPSCWVCLEHTPDESGALPQPTGCACRGGSTDHAHVGCVAQAAQANSPLVLPGYLLSMAARMWTACPTCKQGWTGPMSLALRQRRHDLAADLPEEDVERLNAALDLTHALRVFGRHEEALRLGHAALATCRRVYGEEHPNTLMLMRAVAAAHGDAGDLEAALPTELAATMRRVHGDEHEDTLDAIDGLAVTHDKADNFHLSLPLHQEVLAARRKTLGDGHMETLRCIGNVASTYSNLWELERAQPLSNEAADGTRRLLGGQHPETLCAVGRLGNLLVRKGDHTAAAPLLQEVVDGLAALSVHVGLELESFQSALQNTKRCLVDPAHAAEHQRFLRQRRLTMEAKLPSATAVVIGVQSRHELNGAEVTIKRFLTDKGRYTVLLPPDAAGKQESINLKPANLVLAEGSAVVATGLEGAPELNGQRGEVEGWVEEKGRYVVRLQGGARKDVANLRPDNCRADVLVL
eukprot:COSAG03_NODE_265_length_9695_cov_39.119529_3_plen_584_part_00